MSTDWYNDEFTAEPLDSRRETGTTEGHLLLPAILLPCFLATFDQTVVATAFPTMSLTLGSLDIMPWLLVSYLMANAEAPK